MKTFSDTNSIIDLINCLCANSASEKEISMVVEFYTKICSNYLIKQKKSGKKIFNSDRELRDIAIDCMASLFRRDDSGQFIALKKYFSRHGVDLVTIKKLIFKKTRQELSLIFHDRNPHGSGIIRNIRIAVQTSKNIRLFKERNCQWLMFKGAVIKRELLEIPDDLLLTLYKAEFSTEDHFRESIEKILIILEDQGYRNFIDINRVANLFSFVNYQCFFGEVIKSAPSLLHDSLDVESICNRVMLNVSQFSNFIAVGRREVYKRALADFIRDLMAGQCGKHHEYLRTYLPMPISKYRQTERHQFEYMLCKAKKSLKSEIRFYLVQ